MLIYFRFYSEPFQSLVIVYTASPFNLLIYFDYIIFNHYLCNYFIYIILYFYNKKNKFKIKYKIIIILSNIYLIINIFQN